MCLVEVLSMELVTSKEIAKVIGTDKFGFIGTFVGWILLRLLRISEVNKIYNKLNHLDTNFEISPEYDNSKNKG